MDPLLGRTYPDRAWHPRDGRITELGVHLTVDPGAGNEVVVGINASPRVDGLVVDRELLRAPTIDAQADPSLVEFRDDDAGYLAWLAAHPNGYVINSLRGHNAATARVHHADCGTISGQNPHKAWTETYVKVCAEQLADLEQWATDNVGKPIQPCGTCDPRSAP